MQGRCTVDPQFPPSLEGDPPLIALSIILVGLIASAFLGLNLIAVRAEVRATKRRVF
jgi:hypothetical protein